MESRVFNRIILSAVIAAAASSPMTAGDTVGTKLSPACRIALSDARPGRSRAPGQENPAYMGVFITVADDFDPAPLAGMGARTGVYAGNIITARIPVNAITDVASLPGVLFIEKADAVTPMIDLARQEAGLPYETQTDGTRPMPVTGKGVIVGVIDRGFDYTHEAFRDASGNCRITRVWEQAGSSDTYPAPEKFGYGMELDDADGIAAAAGDVSGNSHGTHVAGIAAGSSPFRDGLYSGVAPEAEIVLVSMDATDGDNATLADAMAYIFDYAEKACKPCVINMSLGSQIGPHDGTSPFDRIADSLAGPGRLLVGSAGNHGNDRFHVSRTFASADDAPLATFIDFKNPVNTANAGGVIDIWGDKDMKYRVELICYSKGKDSVAEILPLDMNATEAKDYLFSENITGPLTAAVETNPINDKLHVMIQSGITSLRNRYYVGIRIVPQTAGTVDIWADNNRLGLTAHETEGYAEPGKEYSTIAEIGGTAASVLTVGAYTTREEYTVLGSTDIRNIGEPMGDICSFSSFGPTADGRQKPEITAPGCFIVSAVSSHDNGGTQILADYNEEGGYRYGYMQGTSMSAPFVAGVVAGWLQIDPTLDPGRLKATVQQTARHDDFTDAGDAIRWGSGKISPREGAISILGAGITDIYADGDARPLTWPGEIVFPRSGKAEITVSDMAGRVVNVTETEVTSGESVRLTRDTLQVPPGLYIVWVRTSTVCAAAKLSL